MTPTVQGLLAGTIFVGACAALYYASLYTTNESQVREAAEAFRTRIGQGAQFRCESEAANAVICKTSEATVRLVRRNNYWQAE